MTYSVLSWLERSAERYGSHPAISDQHDILTYETLRSQSRAVGSALCGYTQPRQPVAVLMEKCCDTVSVFYGAVYAGCFYSLMNPQLTEARLASILAVLKPAVLVTDETHRELAEKLSPACPILLVEDLKHSPIQPDRLDAIAAQQTDLDPLYCNFTSGSTGVPKGVLVGQRSVLDFISRFTELFGFVHEDIIADQAPLDFDVSVKDLYSALAVGAHVVLIPKELFSQPAALLDYLCQRKVTTLTWAVSALCLVTTFHGLDYKIPEQVNKVLFSGEVMPLKHLNQWMEKLPSARFVNLYGPTEITCNCTYHEIDRDRDYSSGIPIGKPFPNEQVFLLNGEDKLVTAPEEQGEVCVAGSALALGYYNAPEQTGKAFTPNPLQPNFPQPIYRTGDLAYWNQQGELVFAGRKDFQIKHQGHRIELEEIQGAMEQVEGVVRACCLYDEKRSRLKGFYVGEIEVTDLTAVLREKLPFFMVPNTLQKLEEMPLTKNGKIDRKALSELKRRSRRDK